MKTMEFRTGERKGCTESESDDSSESDGSIPTKKRKLRRCNSDYDSHTSPKLSHPSGESKWKNMHLKDLHVNYAQTPMPSVEVLEKLKMFSRSEPEARLTCVMKLFKKLLKENLTLSVDLQLFVEYVEEIKQNERFISIANADRETSEQVESESKRVKTFADSVTKWIFSSPDLCEMLNKFNIPATDNNFVRSLFHLWSVRLYDFVNESKRMLDIFLKGQFPDEEVFTSLFRLFTQMHFLIPERIGRKKKLKVRDRVVATVPDIHYYLQDDEEGVREQLFSVIEVKSAEFRSHSNERYGIHDLLSRDVLEQIGLELITQRIPSHFSPTTLTIICIRTKIVFIMLEMSREHFASIARGEVDDEHRSCIYYSEVFDIMKESDRGQLDEIFLWLGAQQCRTYQHML